MNRTTWNLRDILVLALLIRIISIPATPRLSDDVYRFIWDGHVILNGMSPYEHRPSDIEKLIDQPFLFERLNSQDYHSVYPVINQIAFVGSACIYKWFGFPAGTIFLRLFLALCEISTIWLLLRWLNKMQIPYERLGWIVLNPLIIIETYGNLHFEMVMIGFLLLGLIHAHSPIKKGLALALSAASKLLSLMIIPFLLFSKSEKLKVKFIGAFSLFFLILFLPVLWMLRSSGFWQSLDLYYTSFEFNASLYYLARWIGYQIHGYNLIALIGPSLAILSGILIVIYSYRQRAQPPTQWPLVVSIIFTIYLLSATTVHPWYVMTPLVFGVLGHLRYPIVWSYFSFLSYAHYDPHYSTTSMTLIGVEYGILLLFMLWEFNQTRK